MMSDRHKLISLETRPNIAENNDTPCFGKIEVRPCATFAGICEAPDREVNPFVCREEST